ncbi:Rid family detoxifying hydrolase [Actinomadura sp. ATCC 39365]
MTTRKLAAVVGALFIFQMVAAMIGTTLTQAFIDGDPNTTALTAGVALMVCSGLAVVGIGLLMYRILKGFNQKLAFWYPVMRVVEFAVSATCGIYLLTQLQAVPNAMLWVYIPTAVGGLICTYLLFVSGIVPQPVAALGLLGYALLLLGVPLDLLGVLDMDKGLGVIMLAPGGLFEVLVLPLWLFAKGFTLPQPSPPAGLPAEPPPPGMNERRASPMIRQAVSTDNAPQAIGPYSQALIANGFVFCSGTAGIDPATGALPDGIEEQTEQALRNLEAILTAAGASLACLVKTTIFYTNVDDFAAINAIYARHMPDPPPARSAPANVVLPRDLLISIDAIAVLPAG